MCSSDLFFGVFRGRLWIIQRTHDRDHPAFSGDGKFDPRRYCFSVWELEDYANATDAGGTWSFKYKVYFTDIVPERPSLNEVLNGIRSDVNFLAFHPNDAELVLLKFGSYIVSCNMHTGDLNMAGQIPDGINGRFLKCSSSYIPTRATIVANTTSSTPIGVGMKFNMPFQCLVLCLW